MLLKLGQRTHKESTNLSSALIPPRMAKQINWHDPQRQGHTLLALSCKKVLEQALPDWRTVAAPLTLGSSRVALLAQTQRPKEVLYLHTHNHAYVKGYVGKLTQCHAYRSVIPASSTVAHILGHAHVQVTYHPLPLHRQSLAYPAAFLTGKGMPVWSTCNPQSHCCSLDTRKPFLRQHSAYKTLEPPSTQP